ncbi:MAG: DUF1307 domain-containing protein [bacterium]|nr:DUF1307 domain-containing protein [bacterium]
MKKIQIILVLIIALFATGCVKESEEKTMTCTRTVNKEDVKMDFQYNVVYQQDYVKKVESIEKVTTDNLETLNNYKTTVEQVYAPYKDIEYYETEVTISDNTLTSIASIDYENIDIDELIKIDSAYEQLFTNGKISIDTIENLYNQIGVSCTR